MSGGADGGGADGGGGDGCGGGDGGGVGQLMVRSVRSAPTLPPLAESEGQPTPSVAESDHPLAQEAAPKEAPSHEVFRSRLGPGAGLRTGSSAEVGLASGLGSQLPSGVSTDGGSQRPVAARGRQ